MSVTKKAPGPIAAGNSPADKTMLVGKPLRLLYSECAVALLLITFLATFVFEAMLLRNPQYLIYTFAGFFICICWIMVTIPDDIASAYTISKALLGIDTTRVLEGEIVGSCQQPVFSMIYPIPTSRVIPFISAFQKHSMPPMANSEPLETHGALSIRLDGVDRPVNTEGLIVVGFGRFMVKEYRIQDVTFKNDLFIIDLCGKDEVYLIGDILDNGSFLTTYGNHNLVLVEKSYLPIFIAWTFVKIEIVALSLLIAACLAFS